MGEATRLARVIVEELIGRGLTDFVLAPGSRSAPLAYELFDADRIGLLRLHVRIDERTAGFLALGLAKQSGRPVAVVTTSGTAVANLHPAVLEAWHAHLPLIMITASRPRTMINTGGNQTTDQDHFFGRHSRGSATLADQVAEPWSWRFELARLISAATGVRTGEPGPVQLNVELSEPLAPAPEAIAPTSLPPLTIAETRRPPSVEALVDGPQTVIIAGDLPPAAGRELAIRADRAGVPLLAEPSSNARRGSAALGTQRLLAGSALAERIERIVIVGHPTLSRPVSRLLSRRELELIMVTSYPDWIDPGLAVTRVVDAVSFAEPGDPDWLASWQSADAVVRAGLDALLSAQPGFSGPALAAALWAALDQHDHLFVGSSNPIRDLDLAPISTAPPFVYANRGLAGIDGTMSTAIGIGLAAERPTHALLGDVTALHDLTGLIIGPDEPRPDLRVVVANDDGGSIFATLEHGDPIHQRAFERIFGTPHRARFAALAEAVGADYHQVTGADGLAEILAQPPIGIDLVEAVVDRTQRRTLNSAITALATMI